MKLWVGVTDNSWFEFLKRQRPDEVNFWRPGQTPFRAIGLGAPFLFKLHSPLNFVAGGGFFAGYSLLPLSLAWEAFGEKNGTADYASFREAIGRYRERRGSMPLDPQIGCIILVSPFFFEREDWIPIPRDWSRNIVQGKAYDTEEPLGRELWEQVQSRLHRPGVLQPPAKQPIVDEEPALYGTPHLVRRRLGQGAFRIWVTEAYQRRCAITEERTLPVLQAAHIKPYAESGPHRLENGLLLRADLHILFDRGLITVTEDHQVEVSTRIREEYENGHDYYALHGRRLMVLPESRVDWPSADFIRWHNEHVFRS